MTNLIIDTDIGNDIDDALALSVGHYLDSRSECRLIGVAVNKDNQYAPILVDIINTFYGKSDIEIGIVADGKTPEDGNFLKPLAQAKTSNGFKYPRSGKEPQDAVKLYRKLLSESEDSSVVIASIGFLTNLAKLLVSSGDEYSPLRGSDLVSKKVRLLSIMGGDFSEDALRSQEGKFAEYNIKNDIKSAQYVCEKFPSEVIFSGLEVGCQIMYPAESIYKDFKWTQSHPVAEAYGLYREMPYDRPVWDLTSVLIAVREPLEYFDLSPWGWVSTDRNGVTRFTQSSNGKHRYLIFRPKNRDLLRKMMTEMCSFKPEKADYATVSK